MFTYNPNQSVPADSKQLAAFLTLELREISRLLTSSIPTLQLDELHQEPAPLTTGLVALADGVDWNPGSGRGIYWYDAAAPGWVKLG